MTTQQQQQQAQPQSQADEERNEFMIIRTATNQVEYLISLRKIRADYSINHVRGATSETHYTLRGDYPDARLWYYYNRETGAFSIGYPPVNPKAAWSEELEDARTFAEWRALLMQDEAFLRLIGYMDAEARREHDLARGGGGTTPVPAPAPAEGSGDGDSGDGGDSSDGDGGC